MCTNIGAGPGEDKRHAEHVFERLARLALVLGGAATGLGGPDMASRFTELAIDCADPRGLARFWCSVLAYEVQDEDDGLVTIGAPVGPEDENHPGPVSPTLTFAHVPEGKTVKNRLHLDLNPTDREQAEEVRRLLDLGARHADVGQGDETWVVLVDPEGNEFCVLGDRRP
jgi:hypothetical protein